MGETADALENRVIILNGFSDSEIVGIMSVVKSIYAEAEAGSFTQFADAVHDHPTASDYSRRLLRSVRAAKSLPEVQRVSTKDLIFAKTTPNSIEMKLKDLIEDMSEDHEYLKKNPPTPPKATP